MKDPALRACSLAARGLWLDLLCLMFECDRRGYLQINGKPMSLEQIARSTGCSTDEASRCLQELDDSGVFSRSEHGSIYSRRLVRDDQTRAARVAAGAIGGSKTQAKRKATVKQKQSPSSSTSSSSSTSVEEPPKPPPRPPPLFDLFEQFWQAFPSGRKTGKQAAMKAFQAACKRTAPETIIAAAAEYAASPVGRSEYVKGPCPWLNQGCWDDDRAAWQRTSSNNSQPPKQAWTPPRISKP